MKNKVLEHIQNYKGQSIMIYRDKEPTLTAQGLIKRRTFHYGNQVFTSFKHVKYAIDKNYD